MPNNGYPEQRAWSDKYLPKVKRILGEVLLTESTFEEDTQQAADLTILHSSVDGMPLIGVRLRKYEIYERWPLEFTVRAENNGHRTEIDKFLDQYPDWFFYGWLDQEQQEIFRWMVVDVGVWRDLMGLPHWADHIENGKRFDNGDGTKLLDFKLKKFGDDVWRLLVDASEDIKQELRQPIKSITPKSDIAMLAWQLGIG